jgi:2-polyprenyl-3-methyl-5-hydroxy-6-metoxy-1,4-benzoquinol methylase
VVGIEINPDAAKLARERGLVVLEGNASDINVSADGEQFDCIIYADILEHLPNPELVLKKHIAFLKPKGVVIISVPNFRHYSVFWELFIRGHVQYKEAGILDHTHLRITTRKMVHKWFDLLGLDTIICKTSITRRRDVILSKALFGLIDDFLGPQVFAVARKQ